MARILQLTDLHVFCAPLERLKGVPTRESLQEVVKHVLATEAIFDHVVITGDHTHDERSESYAAVAEILQPWRDRLWLIPGNHDDRSLLRTTFAERIHGQRDERIGFQFEIGDWLCVGLDSHEMGQVSGRFTSEQADGLVSILKQSGVSNVVLFLHHPPVDIGSPWMDEIGLLGREHLADVVKGDQRIRLIVCGHVHHDFCSKLHGAEVVATPSTGIQFEPNSTEPAFTNESPGYRIIELGSTTFQTTVKRLPNPVTLPDANS